VPRITEGQFALGGLAAFSLWLFVILPLLYNYPRQETPQSNRQAAQSEQKADGVGNVPPSFVTLKLFTAAGRNEIAAYCAADTKEQENNWANRYVCDIKITDAYLALFNFLLVIVTGGLIGVGFLTIWKMKDTEERQLRAYVFAEPGNLQQGMGMSAGPGIAHHVPRWRFDVKFSNSGQTPAYAFRQFTVADVLNEPVSEASFLFEPEEPISRAPLPAGAVVNTTNTFELSAADVVDIRAGRKSFYVFGSVEFTDAFKRQRRVRFRFIHGHHNVPGDLVYAEAGNDEI
jgi:hypothetical protein